jgi:hypothetical protein
MTSPGIAKTSGIVLSITIIIVTGLCGVFGSFLIARGKSVYFVNLKPIPNIGLSPIRPWSGRF